MEHPFRTMNGYRIVLVKPIPRMELAANVPVTEEFRKKHNAWCLEFFGANYLIPKGQTLLDKKAGILYVREDDYAKLKKIPSNGNWEPYFGRQLS